MKQIDDIPHLYALRKSHSHEPNRRHATLLVIVILAALYFVFTFALPYLTADADRFGVFKPRRDWLLVHVICGTAALLLGPIQLWLVLNRGNMTVHRVLGVAYVMSVAASSVAAFYLAWHTDFGWVFGMGLTALALAWVITTTLAVVAIAQAFPQQHGEWMIRSYVVTFAFVLLRVLTEIFELAHVGTITEQLGAASWLCWSVPLLITESVLQGRKLFPSGIREKLP